ncbi:radial spoke protein 9 [Selaginella moellendorffii]|uniref:Radial spoke head protein 9 homolog n=1 Tax=Selaginella moellendorffii TaxID=88036 RepID=D8QWA6_SELML|nr:hypothetical protein SELMODRAFT_112250 [Selaginella moellendorffii]EFJ36601.1 radial spoke protein 9 [Selaginella moellendorffii]
MAFFNNHTLALDALGTSGFVVPTEQRAAMDTSLVIKKEEAGLSTLGFWGRVYTLTGKDYLVAQGCNGIQTSDDRINVDVKCYYSLDGAKWLDLQPLTDDAYDICKTIQGGFKGDPSQRYKALVRVPPPPPTPPAPPIVLFSSDVLWISQLDRLSALIRAVDEECGVMPVNALVLNARKQLVPNTLFSGVKFPEKLDSYGHLYQRYEDTLLSKDITGSWSVQMTPITGDVILRSLWWPGYSFYYNASTKAYGSLYFGMGDKNLDFAFMVG